MTTPQNRPHFEIVEMGEGFLRACALPGNGCEKTIMWVVPPITAVVTLWYTLTNNK